MKSIRSLVLVSQGPISLAHGAAEIYQTFEEEINSFGIQNEVSLSTIQDVARSDVLPMVIIYPEAVVYGPIKLGDVHHIVEELIAKEKTPTHKIAPAQEASGKISWLQNRQGAMPAEQRVVLERVGIIDPADINDYILHDGYTALGKVLSEMKPVEVINEVEASGLKGRGGAGFPTGVKWRFVSKANNSKKYVVCNADESEPGTFKDRVILEGDPHSILEAMIIAGYAVGADEGYLYIRGEYGLAQKRMQKAIEQAEQYGFLGEHIFGSDHSFKIHIHSGAGAYICGEETALIESIEGKRGEPRARPPYPTTNGLWDKPTLVNNVETLANVPAIIRHGARWYRSIGTPSSPGTKVYTILGNVNVPGLIEVPMGITLREVIQIYAHGMEDNSKFKMAQTGGSSGSIIPDVLEDTPMDFESYSKAGVALGSGALLICNEDKCIVDLTKVLLNFFKNESCGKCNPCRIGNERAYHILDKISEGTATLKDLDDLEKIGQFLYEMSNCGLGQTAASPIRDMLKYFRAEVEAHIRLKTCPVGSCPMSGQVA